MNFRKLFFCLVLSACSHSSLALVILQYHHISDQSPKSTSTSPELFERHLEQIENLGYDVESLVHIAELLRSGQALPDKAVVITFDDGYRSIYDAAFPLLKKRNWPFTVFINSQPHDDHVPAFMSWRELEELSEYGATIANHSRSHPYFLRRDASQSYSDFFADEVLSTEQRIKEALGQSHKLFAYPFGEYDRETKAALKKHGFLAFAQHSGPVPSDVDRQAIPRFPFGGVYGDISDFKVKLQTLALSNIALKLTDERGRAIEEPELGLPVKRPVATLKLSPEMFALSFNCFASGQGQIKAEKKGGELVVQANSALPVGRSRYNCTARSVSGQYYWWSMGFIRRNNQGNWQHH